MANLYYDSDDTTHEQDDDLVLVQYGVKGMRWGIRRQDDSPASTKVSKVDGSSSKSGVNFLNEGFTLKKGTVLTRTSTTDKEIHKGTAYVSFLTEDAASYKNVAAVFSKFGMTHYDMTLRADRDLISPSKKERVEVFLKKMEDPVFKKQYQDSTKRMYIYKIPTKQDLEMKKDFKDVPFKQIMAYRTLNLAIGGKKELREAYLAEFRKRHYDFILDEADSNNKVSRAPIIIIERSNGISLVKVDKL